MPSQSGRTRFVLFPFLLFALIAGAGQAAQFEKYRMAAHDQISVVVFGEPDLSLEHTVVATDGTIAMPLIGQVKLQGLTATEAGALLTQRLAEGYLKNPNVTVSIVEYRQYYVNGEVRNPGGYSYREGLTVRKAIVLAGGFSERASESKITLLQENSEAPAKNVGLNEPIRPGDVITVGESFF